MEHQTSRVFLGRPRVEPGPRPVGESASLASLLSVLLVSSDQATIWTRICNYFSELGFENVLYGYSPDSRGTELGSPEDYLILTTLPPPVIGELVERGYYRLSATFHWALDHVGVASWSMGREEAGLGADFHVPPEAQDFFHRHGLLTGCSIGFSAGRTRGRAVMALIGSPEVPQDVIDRLLREMHEEIFTVAAVGHRCLSALPYHPPGRRLTQRQREVLEWVAEGKTAADIAAIMGITLPTVEKHLRLARQTLGVETTAHALIKASFLNQVFMATPTDAATLVSFTAYGA